MSEPLPLDALADPHAIIGLLGSFWGRTYGGRDEVLACCDAAGDAAQQARQDLCELVLGIARRDVPLFHRERWHLLYLRRSGRLSGVPAFGAGGRYGDGATFGTATDSGPYVWSCGLARVPLIFNRLTAPSRSLICGIDFTLDGGIISFRDDPCTDPLLPARDVLDDSGTIVDREVALWCFAADSDRDYVHRRYGYVLGLHLPSGTGYRDLMNALLDALVGGTAIDQVVAVLAALTGTPVAYADETVEAIFRDAHGLVIVTDQHAYRFPAAAMPIVTPGDVLRRGDQLVDTVVVHDLGAGTVPPGLNALAVGPGILAGGYYADLTFADRAVPLRVEAGPGRLARVSWEIGGHPADVDRFWNEVHVRGVALGQTLAHLLDLRADPADEPTAINLPTTINPLHFLLGNLLRANAFLVRIRAAGVDSAAPGLAQLRTLRRIIPPHVALIVLVDLPPVDDSVKMAAVNEGPDAQDAGPPLAETVARSALRERSRTANVSETCQ